MRCGRFGENPGKFLLRFFNIFPGGKKTKDLFPKKKGQYKFDPVIERSQQSKIEWHISR